MKKILLFSLGLALGIVFSSCSSAPLPMYQWYGYENAAYNYVKVSDDESLTALTDAYQQILDGQEKTVRQVPPPGICADYGFMLIQAGKTEEGKELLLKEKELYPESAQFVDSVLRRIK